MVESAYGTPATLPVTASAETLTTLRDRVELALQDSGNATWATGDIDEAIRRAISQYSRTNPYRAIATLTAASSTREFSLSSLTGLIRVERVWWTYSAATPGYPANWVQFEVWPGGILYIDDDSMPATNDVLRIFYTKAHTLNGLDSAGATTLPGEDIGYIIAGAAGIAAQMRAVELAEDATVDRDVVDRLTDWASEQLKNFRYGANLDQPAWQRYGYAYVQGDIDEALRWALARYTEISPQKAIGTITLSAAGREISLASLTGLLQVERVWWDYDSTDPTHPPDWRTFEVWPGNILFVDDPDEPASGDVARIWYTKSHSINGLDSASVTSIPADHETLIVIGAAGLVTQERSQEQPATNVPSKLREWADLRLKEFEAGLKRIARQASIRASGIAPIPAIDRWDKQDGGW
ncbi:MAG: hypothetical protein A2Z17_07205 [Gammaproteobacteria bacterium RBG_16_66_13]|nr:MAG: hypothetical protein A2Z17_07205 [Gammaproteobacteria bacterium RBG_16_66_13]